MGLSVLIFSEGFGLGQSFLLPQNRQHQELAVHFLQKDIILAVVIVDQFEKKLLFLSILYQGQLSVADLAYNGRFGQFLDSVY